MKVTYDPAKNAENIRSRGLSFDIAADFHPEDAIIEVDARKDYGELRYTALWNLNGRVHVLCFTIRNETEMRVISLRKANQRESKIYEKKTRTH